MPVDSRCPALPVRWGSHLRSLSSWWEPCPMSPCWPGSAGTYWSHWLSSSCPLRPHQCVCPLPLLTHRDPQTPHPSSLGPSPARPNTCQSCDPAGLARGAVPFPSASGAPSPSSRASAGGLGAPAGGHVLMAPMSLPTVLRFHDLHLHPELRAKHLPRERLGSVQPRPH